MPRKDRIDLSGAVILTLLAVLFAANQLSIKLSNVGTGPVFGAALRSVIAAVCVIAWMRLRRIPITIAPGTAGLGLAMGCIFALEFLFLFIALDHTTVTRSTVMLYSMPVWLALAAHFLLPGERITPVKAVGLALAFGAMALALADRGSQPGGSPTLYGDLMALGAGCGWAAVAFVARLGGSRGISPEMQLLWMVGVSAPILLVAAPFFGPLLRDPGLLPVVSLLLQGSVVVAVGFLTWFWMLGTYPAAGVASFSFLSPVLAIALGWLVLDEPLSPMLALAGAGVAVGLVLINWPARRPQVPQKVQRTT